MSRRSPVARRPPIPAPKRNKLRRLHLGDLCYVDANLKYDLKRVASNSPWLRNVALEIGAVNLFDRKPQFSNLFSGACDVDILQADIRGRFVYGQLDARW